MAVRSAPHQVAVRRGASVSTGVADTAPGERGQTSPLCTVHGASGGEGPVGHVRDAVAAAEFLHGVVPVVDVEDVLYGRDAQLFVPPLEVLGVDLRQADVPDLPLLL